MTPKIIELIIKDGDDDAGLDGIALVEMPAHEANFEYFNQEEINPCEEGECSHYILSEEQIPKVIQLFQSFGEPQGDLESQGWEITSVKVMGRHEFQVLSNPNIKSEEDSEERRFRYKYVGPVDERNRPFCAEMMKARRVFRREDIDKMSDLNVNPIGPTNYSIFEWRGSYNCRHKWIQLTYEPVGRIVNNVNVDTLVLDEEEVSGPDTRNRATKSLGTTGRKTLNPPGFPSGLGEGDRGTPLQISRDRQPRDSGMGFSTNPDVSQLSPYVDEITKPKKKPVLNSLPMFEKQEDAELMAEMMGCKGSHPHQYGDKTLYMPCEEHPKEDTDYITDEGEDTDDVGGSDNPMMNYGSILEDFAKVGERGGIGESKKAPKSDTPNPSPKGEGTAKGDASGKRGAVVSERVEKILEDKVKDFNERYKDKLDYGVDKGMLKSVYQRGVGAYNVSHSPKVQSAEQWALARVNAFLYMVKEGRPQNKKYTGDNDLLPKKHPKYQEQSKQEFQSYDDYPESARNNACKVIRWKQEHGDEVQGMTQVGWIRANQLCKGEKISEDTIGRMSGFQRHKKNSEVSSEYKDTPWKDKGYVAWLGWGGTTGIEWASNKLQSIRNEMTFSVFNSEERMLVGPAMVPDKMIIRRNEITGEIYYVYFSSDTIKQLQQKFMEEKLLDKTNIEHGRKFLNGVNVVESWIVEDQKHDKQQVFGMNYPKGTWMIMVKVSDDQTWNKIKEGKLRGFSVQGYFLEKMKFEQQQTNTVLEEIKNILKEVR